MSAEATAYKELIPAWNALGVKVTLVHSGDSQRYVQVRVTNRKQVGSENLLRTRSRALTLAEWASSKIP